jgi:ribonuclease HI
MTKPYAYTTVVADAAGQNLIWAWAAWIKCDAAEPLHLGTLFKVPVTNISEAELLALVNGLIEADNRGYLPGGEGTWVELRSDSMAALRTLRTHMPRLTSYVAAPDSKIPLGGARRKKLTDLEHLALGRIRDLCYQHNFALRLVYTHGHTSGTVSHEVDRRARKLYRDEAKAQGVTKHAQSLPSAHH